MQGSSSDEDTDILFGSSDRGKVKGGDVLSRDLEGLFLHDLKKMRKKKIKQLHV